jgi:hypothetical protein
MKTDLEEDIEDQRHIATSNRQLKKLEDSIIERGHRALSSNEAKVRLKKKKQIERAERKAACRGTHGEKLEPRRGWVEERHRPLRGRGLSDGSPPCLQTSLLSFRGRLRYRISWG